MFEKNTRGEYNRQIDNDYQYHLKQRKLILTLHFRQPDDMTTGMKKERVSTMRKTTRRFFSYLLMGLIILSIGAPSNLGAAFGDSIDLEALGGGHGDWDKSSLIFVGEDGTCDLISADVMNGRDSRDMQGTTTWDLYWIASGNPKDGVVIASGTIPALESGESYTMTYNPANNPNGPDGQYMFMANQRPDHPGTGVLWSGSISLSGCVLEPETGSLTVNKTFSDQNEDEVTVVLYEVTESGDVQVASQETVGHTTTFTGLDLEKSYKIAESPVPAGYVATYPDGQNVSLDDDDDDHEGTLEILNTLIPVDPEKGSLNVTKSYSNGNTTEVTVALYKVTDEGDVLVATQVTSGLATTFSNLDIESTYKIIEAPVPTGYSVSYPNGQTKVISGTEPESLSIRNALIIVDPEKGSLNVTKSYSNGNTTEVTVALYKVTDEGDVLVATQVTSGLATTFSNLDIESTYKIIEAPVPTGYSVSYPNGQTKAISGTEAEVLSIVNTLIPVVNPGGGGTTTTPGTPTVTTTTTTVDRDRADPPVQTIPAEPTPLAAPVIAPEPTTAIPEEIIPLGVPVLPKTGEVPVEVFYGLGGMLTALGALLKRK